jgi:hypothetical protein
MSAEPGSDVGTDPTRYEFSSDLPLRPVAAGTTLVVRGPPEAAPDDLAMRLLAPVPRTQGGAVVVDTDDAPRRTAERWTTTTEAPASRLGVVGCDAGHDGGAETLGAVACVSQPSDLTGLGIQYSKLARSFSGGPRGRLRVGLDSVSTLVLFCDDVQPVYRFLHTLTGRIRSAGQLGVFVFSPSMHDDRVSNIITQPFDAAIDVQLTDDGVREMKMAGLPDQPSTWTPI